MPLIIRAKFVTAESFAFFYISCKCVCQATVITCVCAFSSFAICPFDFPVMPCALTGMFPQFVQV